MKTSEFDYELPDQLIAQRPLDQRSDSRLLQVLSGDAAECQDRSFRELPGLLKAGDLLIFNNTRVIPARLFGHKASGGKIELLIERVLGQRQALCHIKASKSPRVDSELVFESDYKARVIAREQDLFKLEFDASRDLNEYLAEYGHMPLPPYISREDDAFDQDRYQTVYGTELGAVAAPTAGLHFDQALIDELKSQGIETANITLHVGAGTFQPVRVEDVAEHKMHSEWVDVPETLCEQVKAVKAQGGRVVAVGTTVVRSLETAASSGQLQPFCGETSIFITPGFKFNCVDALLTNFHLPCSTLLMLVCAFGGYNRVMQAYQHAIASEYRFYSYGDAMLIEQSMDISQ